MKKSTIYRRVEVDHYMNTVNCYTECKINTSLEHNNKKNSNQCNPGFVQMTHYSLVKDSIERGRREEERKKHEFSKLCEKLSKENLIQDN